MIYLDNNATTRVHPEVLEAMLPFLGDHYGNPSAGYGFGKQARKAVERAREQVAALIEAEPGEIVFTSCGTESINTALHSAIRCFPDRKRLVTTRTEHSATVETCRSLEKQGVEAARVSVDQEGLLDLEAFRNAITAAPTAVASVIWANNETGVIFPIAQVAEFAKEAGVLLHTDAVQAVGKIPVSVKNGGIHLLSLSGHKIHAPKGIGALFVSRNIRFAPYLHGGGQENERRSGTENVASIVGLGKAAELALAKSNHTRTLRDSFEDAVLAAFDFVTINGHREKRLPNTSNLHFRGIDAEAILVLLDKANICCSPGSACSTGAKHPSAVLSAMGFDERHAKSSVRFSFSAFNTADEVNRAVAELKQVIERIREVMPRDDSPVSIQ